MWNRVRQSKVASLPKLAALLKEQNGHLVEFLTLDSKGRQIPSYLGQLAEHLASEQASDLSTTPAERAQQAHLGVALLEIEGE